MASNGSVVTLRDVASALGSDFTGANVALADVHHDSREARAGSLFAAIVGAQADGHDHARGAVARGAAALLVERRLPLDVPQIVVTDSRAAMATAAAVVHGRPSQHLDIIGITGTNGKTTVAHMVEWIGRSAGKTTGLIGTLGARIGSRRVTLERTTPESSDVQRLLAEMVGASVGLVAMEVSSHALALSRVDEITYAVAAFTNLSRDHLDFHGDMDAYFAQKSRLFVPERADHAVIWVDDPWGARLARATQLPVVTVGFGKGSDVAAERLVTAAGKSSFTFHADGQSSAVTIPVPAAFNVANALVAAAACLEAGIEFDQVCAGLETLQPVPGRFEVVPGSWEFQVLVDYAHTPEAVATAIGEARRLTDGRVLAVVGAGGDRDPEKRPLMGAAAATADLAFVTSDNPRSEDPQAIIAAVVSGVGDRERLVVEPDRRAAIRAAVRSARADDIVLVLGKGHEQGQEFSDGRKEPFDDRVVAREEAMEMGGAA